uniref:Uncharacterized protein n=1 Tax=Anguilla anguilla TaxID=7936 RepID=A0A0E9PIN9_ANGAN
MGDYIKKGCNSFNVKLTVYILITYSSFISNQFQMCWSTDSINKYI